MKTAEEILIEFGRPDVPFDENITMFYNAILSAMEEYAEQFKPKWTNTFEQKPPINIDLLAKSPKGVFHITRWREAYNIFDCQCKGESTLGWEWMPISKLND